MNSTWSSAVLTFSERANGTAIVEIARHDKKNALNEDVLGSLAQIAELLRSSNSIKAVVLTGGSFFSAGGDLDAAGGQSTEENYARLGRLGTEVCEAWERLPQLTIAAIEGGAIGGGLSLALACDWRVMAHNAWTWVPEASIGMYFGWCTLPRLAELVGPARAKRIAIFGRRHYAQECHEWGLIDEISVPQGAVEKAMKLAMEVGALPTVAPRFIKRAVNSQSIAKRSCSPEIEVAAAAACLRDPEGVAAQNARRSRKRS